MSSTISSHFRMMQEGHTVQSLNLSTTTKDIDFVDLRRVLLESAQSQKRNKIFEKQDKWNQFRLKRQKIIDKYITLRKNQEKALPIIKYVILQKILNTLDANIKEANRRYELKIRGKFMSLIMSIRWIKRMKRFRPNINELYVEKIRHRFTFLALISKDNAKIKALKMIKLIMEKEIMLCKF